MSREVFAEAQKRAFPGATGGIKISRFPRAFEVLKNIAEDNEGSKANDFIVPSKWIPTLQACEPWFKELSTYKTTEDFLRKKSPQSQLQNLEGLEASPLSNMASGEANTMEAIGKTAPDPKIHDFLNECFDGDLTDIAIGYGEE